MENRGTVSAVVGVAPKHVKDARSLAEHLLEDGKKNMDKVGATTPILAVVTGEMMHVFVAIPFFASGRLGELSPFSRKFCSTSTADGAAIIFDAFTLDEPDKKCALQVYAQWKDGSGVSLERLYTRGGRLIVWESVRQFQSDSDLNNLILKIDRENSS